MVLRLNHKKTESWKLGHKAWTGLHLEKPSVSLNALKMGKKGENVFFQWFKWVSPSHVNVLLTVTRAGWGYSVPGVCNMIYYGIQINSNVLSEKMD